MQWNLLLLALPLVITSTPCDMIQYFLPAPWECLIYLNNYSNKVHYTSLTLVTFSQSMMDQIFIHHKYQNWTETFIQKVFQVQDLTCWFNLWQIINGPTGDSQLKSIIHQSIKSVRIGWTSLLDTKIH